MDIIHLLVPSVAAVYERHMETYVNLPPYHPNPSSTSNSGMTPEGAMMMATQTTAGMHPQDNERVQAGVRA